MSDSENIVDNAVLEDAQLDALFVDESDPRSIRLDAQAMEDQPTKEKTKNTATFTQWALMGNGRFGPVGASTGALPPGIYEPFSEPGAWGLEQLKVSSDEIYELPDMATNIVLEEAERFWNSEDKYRKHNLLYKRGIILYGPPGSGKSVTLKLLMNRLVEKGGIVIAVHNVMLASMCLKAIKRIEPSRNMICIYEDIDEILRANGESHVLSMLDGEHNVDRVMNIATTNYPDRLGARIINRPSRFDRRLLVPMPGTNARRDYLKRATHGALTDEQLQQWLEDTDGMSIAHLRELVAAVYCLDQPYKEVIGRLREMENAVKSQDDLRTANVGFGGSRKKSSAFD